jgi:hypothetical protein
MTFASNQMTDSSALGGIPLVAVLLVAVAL